MRLTKFLLTLIVALGATKYSLAGIIEIPLDVTGFRSFDGLGDLDNDRGTLDLGVGFDSYHVIGIGWNVNITEMGASLFDDTGIQFLEGNLGIRPGVGVFNNGANASVNFSSGGVVDLVAFGQDWTQTSNILNYEFFEMFDDFPNQIDATWNSGTFTLRVDQIAAVPEPTSWMLLGASLVGVVGYRIARRKS